MKREVLRKVLQQLFLRQETLEIISDSQPFAIEELKPSEYMQLAIELEEHVDELPKKVTWRKFKEMSPDNSRILAVFWMLALKTEVEGEW